MQPIHYASFGAGNLILALENTQWRKIKTAASVSFPLFMQTWDYIVEKSKQCKQCHYTCSDASALRRPLKTHNGEKTNKGNQCKFPEYGEYSKNSSEYIRFEKIT